MAKIQGKRDQATTDSEARAAGRPKYDKADRHQRGRRVLPGAGALRSVILGALVFSGGVLFSHLSSATTEAQSPYHLIDQLARVLVLVENDYVDPVERGRLLEGAIKGMVAELDPHSSYLPQEDYAIFQGDTEGRFGGIGVEVDFATDFVLVMGVIETSPMMST